MRLLKFGFIAVVAAALVLILVAFRMPSPPTSQPCSEAWFNYIEANYFSTERENSFGDGVGLDYAAGGGSAWFDYVEAKAGVHHPPRGARKDSRCQLIQGRLASRTYVINDLTGWTFSFARR
ncbi:MAG: hypothetical protein V4801_31150 [Burkholderia gladioli]